MSDLSAFDFFRHEASNSDVIIRTETIYKIVVVLALMPPEKVRVDMLPFLQTKLDDMDQIRLGISTKIGEFVPYIGGATHTPLLIPLLQALLNVEETVVRTAAAASTCQIMKTLHNDNKAIARQFLDLFKRLASDEGGEVFYSRVSACQMLPQLYDTLNDSSDRITMRELFSKLAVDELAIVRRAAALALVEVSRASEVEIRDTEMLLLLKQFVADENYSVKIVAVEALPGMAELLFATESYDALVTEIFPLVKGATEDPSWRIRSAIALHFDCFAKYFLSDETANLLFQAALTLCEDDESEVRINIVRCLHAYSDPVGVDAYLSGVIPVATLASEDAIPNVRKNIAEMCACAALIAGPDGLPATQLSDILTKMLSDEDPMVRVRILKFLPKFAQDLQTLFTRLTPSIKTLYTETCWRSRVEVINSMPAALQFMGVEYFVDQFLALFLTTFKDQVEQVRLAAADCCAAMINSTGADWFIQQIFPTIKALTNEPYHFRVSMLSALQSVLSADNAPESFANETLGMVLVCAKDSVPNVRTRAAQVLGNYGSSKNATPDISRTQIRPALTELQADKDKDVKYFATAATLSCG